MGDFSTNKEAPAGAGCDDAACGDLRNGGGDRLADQLARERYRLVVIDTLSRAIGSTDQNDVGEVTTALAPLQQAAHENNCAVLLVDHHHKMLGNRQDTISDILGSTGKGATADTVLGLYRERGKIGAKLAVTGRDVEERVLDIWFDRTTGCWQLADEPNAGVSPAKRELLEIVTMMDGATLSELSEATGKDRGYLHRVLADLVNLGLLGKKGNLYHAN